MPEISDERLDEMSAWLDRYLSDLSRNPNRFAEEIWELEQVTTLIAEVKAARAGKGVVAGDRQFALTAAAQAFCNRGIDIACPWEGDLDDLERERFDAMVAAVDAYNAALAPPSLEPQGAQEPVAKPLDPLKWVKHVSLDGKDIWFEAKTTICEYIAHPNGRWGCRELSIRERGQGDSLDDAKEAARKHYLALLQGREAADDL